jgi:outer membrane autotransporter protein
MPLSGGGCGSSGTDKASAKTREECEDDYKKTNNGRWGGYITGSVSVNENTLSGVKINSNGITIGSDYRLSGKSALGVAFGAMKSNTDMAGEAGKQDSSGYSLVGYGSFAPTQASFIDFALTAGSGKFDLKRLESAGTTAVADTSGNGIGISLSAGLDWRDQAWAITPYLRAEYLNSKVKGFSERGTNPIQVGNQSLTSSMFSVGAEAQYTASTSWGIFIPHVRIEMQQQSQSSAEATAQAVGSNVQLIVTPDLNKDKSFGNAALGASAQFGKGKTGFLDFEKTFGKENFKDQRITTGFKVEF